MVLTKTMTVEEFKAMPENERRYELVQGVLREIPIGGFRHSAIGLGLGADLRSFVRPRGLGEVTGADGGYRIFSDQQTVRVPDVAFFRANRLLPLDEQDRIARFAPDLVVEAVSPNDQKSEVLDKVAEHLRAGVQIIWLVEPNRRVVTVYRPGRNPREIDESEDLDGEDIVPGFRLAVADIFQ